MGKRGRRRTSSLSSSALRASPPLPSLAKMARPSRPRAEAPSAPTPFSRISRTTQSLSTISMPSLMVSTRSLPWSCSAKRQMTLPKQQSTRRSQPSQRGSSRYQRDRAPSDDSSLQRATWVPGSVALRISPQTRRASSFSTFPPTAHSMSPTKRARPPTRILRTLSPSSKREIWKGSSSAECTREGRKVGKWLSGEDRGDQRKGKEVCLLTTSNNKGKGTRETCTIIINFKKEKKIETCKEKK